MLHRGSIIAHLGAPSSPLLTSWFRHTKSAPAANAAPKINGSTNKSEHDGPNGVATPAAEQQSSPLSDPKPTPAEESRSPPGAGGPATAAASEETKADERQTESKDDNVDMADADSRPTAANATEDSAQRVEQSAESTGGANPVDTKSSEPQQAKSPKPQVDTTAVYEQDKESGPRKEGVGTGAPATSQGKPAQDGDAGPAGTSQHAIGEKEHQPKASAADADVTMEDAPLSAKVSREREDDTTEQPSAKRAKTEPQEDEVQVSTLPTDTKTRNGLEGIENWNNEAIESKPITPYQVKEIRRILSSIKKTKNGSYYKDAVVKLWPWLAEGYLAKIKEPVDLGMLERDLRDGEYVTFGDFKRKLALLYKNCVEFNGETHDITRAGLNVVESVWVKSLAVPEDEPPKKKSKQIPQRHHEQRSAQARQGPGSPPGAEQAATKPKQPSRRASSTAASPTGNGETFAVPPGGVPQIRRASTNVDGDRPKRAIHPPRPKDIDYTSKPTTRRKDPEIQFCDEVLREIMDPKHFNLNSAFLVPVDPVALGIPTYFNIIKKPMDLSTIQSKLNNGEYTNAKQFQADMDLMFNNCFKFNSPGTPVHDQGKKLKQFFLSEWNKKDQWMAKHASSKAASVDSEVSDVESDAEGDVSAAGGNAAVLMNTISTLQEKLQEETMKLNNLYMEDHPNEALIKLQSTVLSTVQQSLLQEKQKLASLKPEKGGRAKGGKPAKGKAAGGPKKAGGAAAAKKGGAAKKAPKKERSFGATERNLIAQALSDPSFAAIDQAISIIKKDTGQAVSPEASARVAASLLTCPRANRKTIRASSNWIWSSSASGPSRSCGRYALRQYRASDAARWWAAVARRR